MKNLAHLQNKFQNFLLEGDNDFQKLIVDSKQIPIETRLGIYSNAYKSRLIESLVSNYPILHAYLGENIFEELASEYIDQFPSHYRSIRWYGDKLSYFLQNHFEYKEYPYLAELALFEWMQTLTFDAADHPVVQFEDVTQIDPESWAMMHLCLHPTLHRIELSWNVVEIWQAVSDNQLPPDPIESPGKITWILWRHNLMNRFCSLSESEAWAIDAILQNLTFGEICEGLCQWVDEQEAGIHAASLLKGWITCGLLSKIII